ncbi:MAG: FKBP-type peptidyl-prolyl cis-trans isomerase [Gemmatimonadales bacterium]|nr:MAG: FKBP-type peptidyl-prolyl cis-trans isomerase [Gemmatimonadales bacterium]
MTSHAVPSTGSGSRSRSALLLAALACFSLVPACTDSATGPGVNPVLPLSEVEFAPELGIDTTEFTPRSSLWIRDNVVGDSAAPAAAANRVVHLYYEGWTSGGFRFDGFVEEDGDPRAFLPAARGPILGLREGVVGMRPGGRRTVLVPPALGFGAVALEGIPPNSWLVLDLRVVEVEGDPPEGG